MNFLKKVAIALAVIGFGINSVSAQTAEWNNVTITVGTASASVELSFDAQGTTVLGYGINTSYDNANMVWTSCASVATVCNDNAGGNSGTVNIGGLAAPGANPLATLVFDTSATPVGVYNITSPTATWVDAAFNDGPLPVTLGTITVTSGPQPDYSSAPADGTILNFSGAIGDPAPTETVDITNGGAATSTLTGTCALTGADAGSFSIVSGNPFSVLQGDPAAAVVVDCSTGTVGTFNASLDCTHDGSPAASPASYPLVCIIASGPQPDYSSAPVVGDTLSFSGAIGDAAPTETVDITNGGAATSTLTGTCALGGADPGSFSIVSGNPFSVLQGDPAAAVVVDCSTGTVGTFNASLDCTHNGSPAASPASYPLVCSIASGPQPSYSSAPAGAITIPLNGSTAAGTNPTADVIITNSGAAGAPDLTGICALTGADALSFSITSAPAISIALGANQTMTVDCDATAVTAATLNATLECTHNGDLTGEPSPVEYPLTCDILAAAATGTQNPAAGPLPVFFPPGGSGTRTVTFSEVGGEGVDITDLSCTIAPGVGFAITSPAAFPATVAAGGSLPVVVTFTDPGDGSETPGTLDCTYTDGTGAVTVSYDLSSIAQAINIPTLSMMGYLVLTLGFGLIGFFAFRRRA